MVLTHLQGGSRGGEKVLDYECIFRANRILTHHTWRLRETEESRVIPGLLSETLEGWSCHQWRWEPAGGTVRIRKEWGVPF